METTWILAAFLAGSFFGIILRKRLKKNGTAPDSGPVTEADTATEPAAKALYAIAESLSDPYDHSAHPRDLLALPDFSCGVALLCKDDYSAKDLVSYYTGDNPVISCMAAEALSRREGDDDVSAEIVMNLKSSGIWILFFALHYLLEKSKTPVVGAVLSQARDWWFKNPMIKQILTDFIDARTTQGEQPAFGDLPEECSASDLKNIAALLEALDKPVTRALLTEVNHWQDSRVDRGLLSTVGRIWGSGDDVDPVVPHPVMAGYLEQAEDALLKAPHRSVLLVGESGVGKTSLVNLLAGRLQQSGWSIFESSAADVLAGQKFIGELEERVKNMLATLDVSKRVLWYIPNFHELLYAGAHRYDPTGLLDLVLPAIEKGTIVVIGEIQPEAYERLVQARRLVRAALESITIRPLTDKETLALAEKWATGQADKGHGQLITSATLHEGFQLVKSHLTAINAPGNLLQFLKLTRNRLAGEAKERLSITLDDLLVTLSQLTNLPKSILDDREELDLAALGGLFQQRVIGQAEAVACLVERVAMLKAGLTDPTRPLGVFLFAGPTGTGKTEIAKTLAEFLFGSPERMIRLDMSELQTADSISRILADKNDADYAKALVNQIRRQPFSVVLLDEFEKAHRNIWDLFLQVFDDGRLTDATGNVADFRHSIIILTSNLGATLDNEAAIGFTSARGALSPRNVERAVSNTFRREFINRIDRVVIFRPLSRNVMRKILQKELNDVLQRRGLRNREWAVEWEDSALEFLLDKGFTHDLGARPLKRAVERYLLSPLSITIVKHEFPEGDQFLFVRSDGKQLQVEFIDPNAPALDSEETGATGPHPQAESDAVDLKTVALAPQGSRPEMLFLSASLAQLTDLITSEQWCDGKAEALAQTGDSDFWDSAQRFSILNRIEIMDRIESGLHTAGSLLNRLSKGHSDSRTSFSPHLLSRLAQQLYLVDAAYRDFIDNRSFDALLLVEALPDLQTSPEVLTSFFTRICGMYRQWAEKRRMRYEVLQETGAGIDKNRMMLAVSGFGAYSLLEAETGLHIFEAPNDKKSFSRCKIRVRVVPQPDDHPYDQQELLSMGRDLFAGHDGSSPDIVRRYRTEPSPLVRDSIRKWRTGRLDLVLGGDFDLIV